MVSNVGKFKNGEKIERDSIYDYISISTQMCNVHIFITWRSKKLNTFNGTYYFIDHSPYTMTKIAILRMLIMQNTLKQYGYHTNFLIQLSLYH